MDGLQLRGRRLSAILQAPPPLDPFALPGATAGVPVPSLPAQPEGGPTLVRLHNLVGEEEAAALGREESEELVANVTELCGVYGRVVSVRLALDGSMAEAEAAARRGSSGGSSVLSSGCEGEAEAGGGAHGQGPAVLVRFETPAEAQRAVAGLGTRVVQGQRIGAALVREWSPSCVPAAGSASLPLNALSPFIPSAAPSGDSVASGGSGNGSPLAPGLPGCPLRSGGVVGDLPSSSATAAAAAAAVPALSLAGSKGGFGQDRRFPPKYMDAAAFPKLRGEQAGGLVVSVAAAVQGSGMATQGAGGGGAGPSGAAPAVVVREDAVLCTEELEEKVRGEGHVTVEGWWPSGRRLSASRTIIPNTLPLQTNR